MKVEKRGRRIVVSPSEADERTMRRRAWAEAGPEAFEELVERLRSHGVNIPQTGYERQVRRRSGFGNRGTPGG